MTNIVLIGMPGCGKSTLGRQLAESLGRTLVDTDQRIEAASGRSIPEIFATQGEAGFRQIEAQVIQEAAAQWGQVISCGGGAVLALENRRTLRQNGRIYLVESDLNQLDRSGRPLSSSQGEVERMAQERGPIYRMLADAVVWNDLHSPAAGEKIKEDFYAHFGD